MLSSPKRKGHRNMARLSTVFPQQFHDMALERGVKSYTRAVKEETSKHNLRINAQTS
jgi:hypothetical protein